MTDSIVKVTIEGRNDQIVRLWTRDGNQVDLRPTDPDTAFQAQYAADLIENALAAKPFETEKATGQRLGYIR